MLHDGFIVFTVALLKRSPTITSFLIRERSALERMNVRESTGRPVSVSRARHEASVTAAQARLDRANLENGKPANNEGLR